jgi:threonine synthase
MINLNKIEKGSKIVAVLTGHGLKDPDTAISMIKTPQAVEPDLNKILKIIGL